MKEEETRVIDSNGLMAKRLKNVQTGFEDGVARDGEEAADGEGFSEGFADGLSVEELAGLVSEDGEAPAVIKAQPTQPVYEGPSPEELVARAQEEIQEMRSQAQAEIEEARRTALDEGRREGESRGYAEGMQKAEAELAGKRRELEQEYENRLSVLEPEFIRHITGIYERIFHVQLDTYHDVVLYLLSDCMQKCDGSRNFIVHVSAEDYPYVSMQKKQLTDMSGGANVTVEIVEDITLRKSECMVETEGGVFDCSLDVELEALRKELMLLSYEE